jgi:hypothetical protein
MPPQNFFFFWNLHPNNITRFPSQKCQYFMKLTFPWLLLLNRKSSSIDFLNIRVTFAGGLVLANKRRWSLRFDIFIDVQLMSGIFAARHPSHG